MVTRTKRLRGSIHTRIVSERQRRSRRLHAAIQSSKLASAEVILALTGTAIIKGLIRHRAPWEFGQSAERALLAAKEDFEEQLSEVEQGLYDDLDEEDEDDPWGDVDESGEEDEESLESHWDSELPVVTPDWCDDDDDDDQSEIGGDNDVDVAESDSGEDKAFADHFYYDPSQFVNPDTVAYIKRLTRRAVLDEDEARAVLQHGLDAINYRLILIDAARTPENVLDVLWFVSLLSLPTGAAQELHLVGTRRGRRDPRDRHELAIRPPDPGYRELCLHLPNAPSSTRRLMAA